MATPADDWQSPETRRAVIQKLEEAINNAQGQSNSNVQQKNPADIENAIFLKSKSRDEYNQYIRHVILMFARQKNMQAHQVGQPHPQGMPPQHPGQTPMMQTSMPPQVGMTPGGYQQQQQQQPAYQQFATGQAQPAQLPRYQMYQQQPRYPGGAPQMMSQPSYAAPPQQLHSGPVGGGAQYGTSVRYMGPGQQMMAAGGMQQTMRPPGAMRMPGMVSRPPGMGGPMRMMPQGVPGNTGMGMPGSGMVQQPGQHPQYAGNSYMMDGSGPTSVQAIPNPSYSASAMRPPVAPPYTASVQQTPSLPNQTASIPSPYNSIMGTASPSQPSTSLPNTSVPQPPTSQQPPGGVVPPSSVSQQQDQTQQQQQQQQGQGGGAPQPQITNPATPRSNLQALNQPVPSPAPPPTPLFPASPATSVGSPAQQPSMTPEENEAYVRKLSEYQKYIPLLQKWIQRLGKDEKKGDQYVKVKSLLSLLQNDQRRVPLPTLIKCGDALERMFHNASALKDNNTVALSSTPPVSSSAASQPPQPAAQPPVPTTTSGYVPPSTTTEPVVPPTHLTDPSKSRSLMEFKMIPSPPPTYSNLMETIQSKPFPCERLPPAKRLCNRADPPLSPSLKRELVHLEQFKIDLLPKEDRFDKATTLKCSLTDSGLPQVPSLTIQLPPSYPMEPPMCDLKHYFNGSNITPFVKDVGKLLSEKLSRSSSNYSLSSLLTDWESCVLRAMSKELSAPEE